MKKLVIFLILIIVIGFSVRKFKDTYIGIPFLEPSKNLQNNTNSPKSPNETSASTVIAENLDTPWGIAFLPNRDLIVSERPGTVKLVDTNNNVIEVAKFQNVREAGEGGLLGIAVHPDFLKNNYMYFYYTYESRGNNTLNRVVRMTFRNNSLEREQIIVDRIPGAQNHNGGRIKFGPDKLLYITTGDAQEPSLAQNRNSLAGKILRVTDDGKNAPNNPFNNQVFSYGHRNPQGIAWDGEENLWQSEHGRSLPTGFDEINFIERGKNYGWPDIQGGETQNGMIPPVRHSGPNTAWAPGSAAFIGNSLFFCGLRGQTLYEAVIEGNKVVDFKEHFKGQYGRLRDAVADSSGMLYITTSNRDGRGEPSTGDDKIIRVDPSKL